jgi:hypothetical protein
MAGCRATEVVNANVVDAGFSDDPSPWPLEVGTWPRSLARKEVEAARIGAPHRNEHLDSGLWESNPVLPLCFRVRRGLHPDPLAQVKL